MATTAPLKLTKTTSCSLISHQLSLTGKDWTQIQGRHILDDPEIDHEKQSSDRWLKLILDHLWPYLWQLWLARNDDLHGQEKDEKDRKRLLLKLQRPRVLALYSRICYEPATS